MLHSIKDTLKDFFTFLKKPADQQDIIQSKSHQAKRLCALLAIDILLTGLLTIMIIGFETLGWINTEKHKTLLLLDGLPVYMVLAFTIVIIPFAEEIIFRLFLRFKRNYLFRFILFAAPESEKSKTKTLLLNFWTKRFASVFYLSVLAFGLIHIPNFDSKSTVIYLFPVLILPQFISGLFIGYLRVRYNFITGFLMHAIHNAVFIIMALLFTPSSAQKLKVTSGEYELKIEEVTRSENSSATYARDSVNIIGLPLKSIISALMKKDDDLIGSNNDALLSRKITLSFKSKSSPDLNKDSIIISHLSEVYAFRLVPEYRSQKVCHLYVKDTLQLLKHASPKDDKTSNTIVSAGHIKAENITLDQMAKELGNAYKRHFETDNTLPQKWDISVPNGNMSELEKALKTDYGICLKETEKKVAYIYLNVQK